MIKDKKNMKKRWKRIISNMIAIALVIISSIPTISIPVKAEASVDGKLITVGGKTVTKNMKIDDVKKMFGEPKLTTPSYWDGYAYTFYGKDYTILIQSAVFFTNSTRSIPIITQDEYSCKHIQKF